VRLVLGSPDIPGKGLAARKLLGYASYTEICATMKSKLRRSFWITVVVSALSVLGSDMVSSGQVINFLRFLYFVCVVVGAAFAAGWCFLAVRERFGPSVPALVVSILLALASALASAYASLTLMAIWVFVHR